MPVVVLVILLVVGIAYWLGRTPQTIQAPGSTEPVEKLTDSIAIPGYEGLTLLANSRKQTLVLPNPPENTCLFRMSLILEDGTVLWTSKYIKPGENSDPIKLSDPLAAGTYPNAMLKYECFTTDKTPLNGAEIKLTLRVQESIE